MRQNKIYIYGTHAVTEALTHAPRAVSKVLVGKQLDPALRALIKKSGIPMGDLDPRKLTSQVEGRGTHQGVVALMSLGSLEVPFDHFIEKVEARPETLLVLMSEVQDPHNVGAAIRSAAAFGATAVLLPTHKQAPITGAAVKASAGMVFSVPLVTLPNMQQALAQLKKKGFRVYGLAADGGTALQDEPFAGPTILAFGNEGAGLPPSARALCDTMLSIPMDPRSESLNVAASAAVALYAWRQKRH